MKLYITNINIEYQREELHRVGSPFSSFMERGLPEYRGEFRMIPESADDQAVMETIQQGFIQIGTSAEMQHMMTELNELFNKWKTTGKEGKK